MKAGRAMLASTAMIVTTISNSISVKAAENFVLVLIVIVIVVTRKVWGVGTRTVKPLMPLISKVRAQSDATSRSSLEEERKLARVAALNCWRSHAKHARWNNKTRGRDARATNYRSNLNATVASGGKWIRIECSRAIHATFSLCAPP